ncbi:gastrula zinc finger protein xFG20-1-like [Colletes gigas]|uniref:gastrula zinc finger protein xFG20-1-like n=1 Tax=Colletes gigas TaxID=935657 RepID=UPI001C9A52D2|nr:gastrula zinc finger protein xFG20-1-like [Colletes gigas]
MKGLKGITVVSEKDSWNCCSIAGLSSCCQYSESLSDEGSEETDCCNDNNNICSSHINEVHCCALVGPSSTDPTESCTDNSNARNHDGYTPVEAVNLCKKEQHENDISNTNEECDDKRSDSLLYKFLTDPTFLGMIRKDTKLRRYECQFCKQEFVNSDELADHMDVKKDASNQIVCCACNKTFAYKRYLKYHQKCHSEKAKYSCTICRKKYTRIDNLTRHNTVHVNPNKFWCTMCKKTFTRKDCLNNHLKSHDVDDQFFCKICQKDFEGPFTLDHHKRTVHSTAESNSESQTYVASEEKFN